MKIVCGMSDNEGSLRKRSLTKVSFPTKSLQVPALDPGGRLRIGGILLLAVSLGIGGLPGFGQSKADRPAQGEMHWDEGAWTQRLGATVHPGGQGVLRIEVHGEVEIRPAEDGVKAVRYEFLGRAASRSEALARQEFAAVRLLTESSAEAFSVGLTPAAAKLRASRLRLMVPAQFHTVKVRQLGGPVSVADLAAKVYAQIYAGEGEFRNLAAGLVVFSGGGMIAAERVRGDVEISSGGGSASIFDVKGAVRCELGGGDIDVRDISGAVDVSTGGGNVIVERAMSSVVATTQGGLLEVKSAKGPVLARNREGILRVFSSGDVKAYAPTGPIQVLGAFGSLQLATSGGSVYVELSERGVAPDSRIVSESGNITLSLPPRLKVTVEAESRCGCGSPVISDYALAKEPWVQSSGIRRIPLNGGGTVLRVATQQGRVVVKKAR